MFFRFARRTGHPHPHLQDAITNYTALLIQMGHSQDEIAARLKRLAPKMLNRSESPDHSGYKSTDNHPKEE